MHQLAARDNPRLVHLNPRYLRSKATPISLHAGFERLIGTDKMMVLAAFLSSISIRITAARRTVRYPLRTTTSIEDSRSTSLQYASVYIITILLCKYYNAVLNVHSDHIFDFSLDGRDSSGIDLSKEIDFSLTCFSP